MDQTCFYAHTYACASTEQSAFLRRNFHVETLKLFAGRYDYVC